MNNELQIFTNDQFGDIRTIEENGKVLFLWVRCSRSSWI